MNKEQPQNAKKLRHVDIKIKSLDIDKAEYQEIVLSNSNFSDRDCFKKNFYD